MAIITDIETIKINEIEFTPIEGVDYAYDYVKIYKDVANGTLPEIDTWRKLIKCDLFFILYFVMGIKAANKEFVVESCKEVERGPKTMTLDVWAREHYKSTIITVGETLQFHLNDPERCTGLFAYARPLAKSFLRAIKVLCETSAFLKVCFPDVLWENPQSEAPKWSEDDGLVFKRKASARRESTIEAWGLVEGMPTGRHFDRRIYDDIETQDIADNPDQLNKCFSKFEMSDNLGMEGGIERIIGTFYSHAGPIVKIRDKKDLHGDQMYTTRIKAATKDATGNGEPVLLSQERIDKLKMSAHFNSQQLCDPTPIGDRKLSREMLIEVEGDEIPDNLAQFLLVDWAGDGTGSDPDAWAIGVIGIDADVEDIRTSDIYILDMVLTPMKEATAIDVIIRMYLRNRVEAIGIEKINSKILGLHVAGILNEKYRRRITEEDKTLIYLKPAGREKKQRISTALEWPFLNGKVHMADTIDPAYRDRFKQEMDNFPVWHDDGLDFCAYIYDIMEDSFWKHKIRTIGGRRRANLDPFARKLRVVPDNPGTQWMVA